jgi:hypothetical protein
MVMLLFPEREPPRFRSYGNAAVRPSYHWIAAVTTGPIWAG